MLAALAVATVAGATWFTLSNTDDSTDDASPVDDSAPPADLDFAPQDVSSPLVAPIHDAADVVAEIDDNSGESEALDMLGLDETGNVVAAGHRFTWNYGTDDTTTITVDATTGNYAFESSDGVDWRRIDGTSYGRRGDLGWAQVDGDTLESAQRLGLDGPATIEQIVGPLTDEYASTVTDQRGDGTSVVYAEIDAHDLWSDHPDEHLTWLGLMGIPNPNQPVEPGSIIVVDALVAADGRTVETLTVTTSTFTSSYTLNEVFDTAPVIEVPEI